MIWSTLIITAVRYDFKMILNTNYFIIFYDGWFLGGWLWFMVDVRRLRV